MRRHLFLVTLSLLLACEQDELIEPEKTIPASVQPYIDQFIREAEKRGLTLDISDLSVELGRDLNIPADNDQQTVVGSCSRSENLDLIKIDTLNSLWLLSGPLGREEIMFHELGHCLLGRQHRDDRLLSGDYASIMRAAGLLQYGDLDRYSALFLNPTGTKAHKRDYYLDELFDSNTGAPCWSDPGIGSPFALKIYDESLAQQQDYRNLWIDSNNSLWIYGGFNNYVLPEGRDYISFLPVTRILDLQNDSQGNLWVAGTKEGRPFILVFQEGQLNEEPDTISLPEDLSGIDKILIDDTNRLWLTDLEGKIYVRQPDSDFIMLQLIPERRVSKILRGPGEKVYLLKGQEFVVFDADLNPVFMNSENSELPADRFIDMAVDNLGVAWMYYSRPAPNLVRFNPDGQVAVFNFYDINMAEINLNSMTIDHLNNLWIATNKGIKKWEGNSFSDYCTYNSGLGILDFSTIVAGDDGVIWSIGRDTVNLERRLLRARLGI